MVNAVDRAREAGLLGPDVMRAGFAYDIRIRRGGGAYIAGEGTALYESVEGNRAEPRNKAERSTTAGLFRKPTAINNVETLANVPLIVLHGGPGLDHHEFGAHLDPLAERGMRLLLTDLRANGRSEPCPPSTWTLERMAQDVIMLALALKLGRYAVLGHSYGAFMR